MDEAILDVVELIDVLHNFRTLFRYKVLDKSVSAREVPRGGVYGFRAIFCFCKNK